MPQASATFETSASATSTQSKRKPAEKDKQSKIWLYFEIYEDEKDQKENTRCLIDGCGDKLVYHKNTSSMLKHMKTKHSDKYNGIEKKGTPSQQIQSTITSDDFKMKEIKELTKERINQITTAIANFIAIDMRPINVIEGEGFKDLIRTLEPRFNIPSQATFSQNVPPKVYEKVRMEVKKQLQQAKG